MAKRKTGSIVLFPLLPLLVAFTLISLLLYVVMQQSIRLGANEIPIELAENTARSLATQNTFPQTFPPDKIDISKSISPFIYVFDKDKRLIGSTAIVSGKTPEFPQGVLDNAKKNGEDRVTWQTVEGIRSSTVTVYFKDKLEGYIVAGKSLSEVEKRIDTIALQILIGYLVGVILIIFAKDRLPCLLYCFLFLCPAPPYQRA